ncbi:hypothetical protein ACNA6I_22875 [Rossellomorea sp. FS2]|uniref:hypothetical protein n=1 Tax=Rossellomorea sp. FS2 TaxID=3391447 RepID=UPI003A4DB57C
MKMQEVVEILNSKKMKVQELADQFEISKDLLSDILKENGYEFSNKSKLREYVGEGSEPDQDFRELISQRKLGRGKTRKDSERNYSAPQKKVRKKSEKTQTKVSDFTDEEIKFVKELFKDRQDLKEDFDLTTQLNNLPPRKPSKKVPYEISLKTFEDFEDFSKRIIEQKRMTRNDLVEMALKRFMEDVGTEGI